MIEEREVITVVLSLFAGLLAYRNRKSLAAIPAYRPLLGASLLLLIGIVNSVLEGIAWADGFNALEHVAYGSSSLLLALSVWLGVARGGSARDGRG